MMADWCGAVYVHPDGLVREHGEKTAAPGEHRSVVSEVLEA